MKHVSNLRLIAPSLRKMGRCFMCDETRELTARDVQGNFEICKNCVPAAIAADKMVNMEPTTK